MRNHMTLLFIALTSLPATLPLQAGIVANPSFEATGNCRGYVAGGCAGQAPWVFTPAASGSAFGVTGGPAPGGGLRGAYFGGMDSEFDTISQTLSTAPGQVYTLSFWLDTGTSGHSTGDFRVSWNGVVLYEDPPGTDAAHQFPYTKIVIPSLAGTGSDTLAFQGYNYYGNDRFDLVDLQPVPEPATFVLVGAAVALLVSRRRSVRRTYHS